jgi:hypothetical protein
MLNCSTLIKYFGVELLDISFQNFLNDNFNDLTEYNILDTDYIISDQKGLELGFTNTTAIYDDDTQELFEKGNPIFSHFNLYSKAGNFINDLPFNSKFEESRDQILKKAGNPSKSREGYIELLQKHFRIDNYQLGDTIISFDYNPETNELLSLQFRSSSITSNEV